MYKTLVGSRACYLENEKSDYDIYQINDKLGYITKIPDLYNIAHYINRPFDNFLNEIFLQDRKYYPTDIQTLFPRKFFQMEDDGYLLENREKIIFSNLPTLYKNTFKKIEILNNKKEFLYEEFPKRYMYSIYYLNFLIDYHNKQLCEYCMKPEEDIRQYMLAIRKNEISLIDYEKKYNELYQSVIKLEPWYNSFNINYDYQTQVKQDLTQLFKEYCEKNLNEKDITKEDLIWL